MKGFGLIELLIVIAIVLVLGVGVMAGYTQSACLGKGYPKGMIDWTLTSYCIKRVDQTDVVVPLKSL